MKKFLFSFFLVTFLIGGLKSNAQINPYDVTGQKTAVLVLHYLELEDKGVKFASEDELQVDIKNTLAEVGFSITDDELAQVRSMVNNAKGPEFWNTFNSSNSSEDLKKITESIISNIKNTNPDNPETIKTFYDFIVNEENKVIGENYQLSEQEKVTILIGLSAIKHTMLTLADDISLTANMSKSGNKVIHAKYSPEVKKMLLVKFWKWLAGAVVAIGTAVALIATGGGLAPAVIAGGSFFGGTVGFMFGWLITEANR